jgi:hypothetical protein
VGSVQGVFLTGSTTNDNTPTVSGKANSDAAFVKVYEGAKLLGTATVSNGIWMLTPADADALSEGQHTLNVRAVDAAGNEATADSASLSFQVVTTIPTMKLANDTGLVFKQKSNPIVPVKNDLVSSDGTVNVTGLNCTTWQYSTDGGTNWSTNQSNSTSTFTLDEGEYDDKVIQVRQIDGNGNTQDDIVSFGKVVIDKTAPGAPILTNYNNVYNINIDKAYDISNKKNGLQNILSLFLSESTGYDAHLKTYSYNDNKPSAIDAQVVYTINKVESKTETIGPIGDNGGAYGIWIPIYEKGHEFVQGYNTISTHFIDLAGNVGPESNVLTYYFDTIAPTATLTAGSGSNTGNAAVKSNEVGTAYLVHTDVAQTIDLKVITNADGLKAITNAADNKWNSVDLVSANTPTSLSLNGLTAGTYELYVTDGLGNLGHDASQSYTVI